MNARVRRLRLLFWIQVWCESFQSRVKVLKLYIAGQTARPFAKEKFHMSAPFRLDRTPDDKFKHSTVCTVGAGLHSS